MWDLQAGQWKDANLIYQGKKGDKGDTGDAGGGITQEQLDEAIAGANKHADDGDIEILTIAEAACN